MNRETMDRLALACLVLALIMAGVVLSHYFGMWVWGTYTVTVLLLGFFILSGDE